MESEDHEHDFAVQLRTLLETTGNEDLRYRLRLNKHAIKRLKTDQQGQLLSIAREAVSNAIRHGAAELIQISLRERNHTCEFIITDTGNGFNVNQVVQGHGLVNIQKRAKQLDGTASIQSSVGTGAKLIIQFPFTGAPDNNIWLITDP
jgi:signal transduction histidine kinase